MSPPLWSPHITVAAVIERGGRYLLVEEETEAGQQFNQPAGHWEAGESLQQGSVREALEETAYHFQPEFLLGVYLWTHPLKGMTYLRFAFGGQVAGHEPERPLDEGIVRAVWLTPAEIEASRERHRSPLVWQCVQDHMAGRRLPLDSIHHWPE